MRKISIKVGSVTYAVKAKNILQRHGMRAQIHKIVGTSQNEGCAYSVTVLNPQLNVGELLRREGVAVGEMKWVE